MSDLVVIAFPSEEKAEEVRQKLLDLQNEYLIELGDAVVAVKQANGRIKLSQLFHTTAAGAVSGTFWGSLVGLIFLMPLVGRRLAPPRVRLGRPHRCRHQRRFHEASRAGATARNRRPIPAHPKDDHGQGACGTARRKADGVTIRN